jgi:hypothetical protein
MSDQGSESVNEANKSFYNAVTMAAMRRQLERIDLLNSPDCEQIADLIREQDRPGAVFWEIGAGFGRVVDFLLSRTSHALITAWEYAHSADYLSRHYGSEARVRVRGDVLQAPSEPRDVALALWMFSGFLDLARPEKEAAIGLLLRRLIPGGYLVIDIAHLEQDGVLELTDQGNPYTLQLHLLTPESLIGLAEAAGFELFRQQRYTTASGKRVSCVFTVRS